MYKSNHTHKSLTILFKFNLIRLYSSRNRYITRLSTADYESKQSRLRSESRVSFQDNLADKSTLRDCNQYKYEKQKKVVHTRYKPVETTVWRWRESLAAISEESQTLSFQMRRVQCFIVWLGYQTSTRSSSVHSLFSSAGSLI